MPAVPPSPPGSLLERLRADPVRAPEALALASVEQNAPAAASWMADKQARFASSPEDLARMAIRKHAQWGRASGAVTGLGGWMTMAPDLAALAWLRTRVVLFVAAAHGLDPAGPERAAELLVVQGLYPTVEAAQATLDGAGQPVALACVDRRMSGEEQLVRVLAKMAGRKIGAKVASRFIPGVASITGAIGNGREVREVGARAIAFYAARARQLPPA